MSLLNGKVEATESEQWATYREASDFIDRVIEQYGPMAFEGIMVREDGYHVNYTPGPCRHKFPESDADGHRCKFCNIHVDDYLAGHL